LSLKYFVADPKIQVWQISGLKAISYGGSLGQDALYPAKGQWNGRNLSPTILRMNDESSILGKNTSSYTL
jgi:hypothetical protein